MPNGKIIDNSTCCSAGWMSSSGGGSRAVRPHGLATVGSSRSRKSRACIRKRFGGVATNWAATCVVGRRNRCDCLAAGVPLSKKRSHADRGSPALRRPRNGGQSVFGRKVGAVAVAGAVPSVGPAGLPDDDRPFVARPKVWTTEPPQGAAHRPAACGARPAVSPHRRTTRGISPYW